MITTSRQLPTAASPQWRLSLVAPSPQTPALPIHKTIDLVFGMLRGTTRWLRSWSTFADHENDVAANTCGSLARVASATQLAVMTTSQHDVAITDHVVSTAYDANGCHTTVGETLEDNGYASAPDTSSSRSGLSWKKRTQASESQELVSLIEAFIFDLACHDNALSLQRPDQRCEPAGLSTSCAASAPFVFTPYHLRRLVALCSGASSRLRSATVQRASCFITLALMQFLMIRSAAFNAKSPCALAQQPSSEAAGSFQRGSLHTTYGSVCALDAMLRTTVFPVSRDRLVAVVSSALRSLTTAATEEPWFFVRPKPPSLNGITSALDVITGSRPLIILISGAAGCGKSTLACLLANRLGISTVVSTDTVRHILRSVSTHHSSPLLYASTYETGAYITDDELSKRKHVLDTLDPIVSPPYIPSEDFPTHNDDDDDMRCLLGYLAQCEILYNRLEFLIEQLVAQGTSVIVEGVHVTGDFMKRISAKFPGQCRGFLTYISKKTTHADRFANRSRNFTTDPSKNKYVQHLRSIRAIQNFLRSQCRQSWATSIVLPVNNVSASVSVRLMHAAVVQFLTERR